MLIEETHYVVSHSNILSHSGFLYVFTTISMPPIYGCIHVTCNILNKPREPDIIFQNTKKFPIICVYLS